MKPLAESFKSGGFNFRQLCREGNVALFEKTKGERNRCYEVVRIQQREARLAFGKTLPACEVMPSSERWGKDGWTYRDLPSAQKKFRERVEAQERAALGTPTPKKRVSTVERAAAGGAR